MIPQFVATCDTEGTRDTVHLRGARIILFFLAFVAFHRKNVYWKSLYSTMIFENVSVLCVNHGRVGFGWRESSCLKQGEKTPSLRTTHS